MKNNHIVFKFGAYNRCLMVLDKEGNLLDSKFYGEFEENISSKVKEDIKQWLNNNILSVDSYSYDLDQLKTI